MDIPLSSDALDIAFHPASTSSLLATGLISGKVQLLDYSALEARRGEGGSGVNSRQASVTTTGEGTEEEEDSTDEDEESSRTAMAKATKSKGKSRLYDKKWTLRPSSKSCRGVNFDADGSSLYSLSKDGSMFRLDTETGSVVTHWRKAHDAAPSRLLCIEPNLIATGDDDGVVSLWDPRKAPSSSSSSSSAAVRSYTHHFDWITSLLWCPHLAPPKAPKVSKEEQEKRRLKEEKKRRKKDRKRGVREADEDDEKEESHISAAKSSRERLVCTSGDGTLSVIDIRSGSSSSSSGGVEVSEDQEDELLSIASVKQDSKLVVGTQMGILSLWAPTRGLLDHVDRIPGHPASVDAMCTLDHDTILTGSSDGLVRVVQILPHKLLGIVADHNGLPVERLAKKDMWLASIGHGAEVKLTDLKPLLEDDDEDEEDDEEGEEEAAAAADGSHVSLQMDADGDASSGSDRDDDDDDDDDESGDSDSDASAQKPVAKKSKLETNLIKAVSATDKGDSFFADL